MIYYITTLAIGDGIANIINFFQAVVEYLGAIWQYILNLINVIFSFFTSISVMINPAFGIGIAALMWGPIATSILVVFAISVFKLLLSGGAK